MQSIPHHGAAPRYAICAVAGVEPHRIAGVSIGALNTAIFNDGPIRVSVGAVNVGSGNLVYFDNAGMRLGP